jgi:uncharacterized protein YdeI (YjbR/CyaY-like superfamily)
MSSGTSRKASDKPLLFASPEKWETWLETNHASADEGVWLRFFKKGSGQRSITYAEAVETALCYGWIDGQGKSEGELSSLVRFTPRRARSVWSKRNTEHAERLIADGRMKPAGLAAVQAAKGDGRWARAYASPSSATVPEDFLNRLRKNGKAKAFFDTLNRRNTYAIYYRIQNARTAETRERRIRELVEMLAEGRNLYP